MENYLKVYPKHGFLNTEYKVRSENEDSFTILFNGQKMFEGVVKAGETKVLPKLNVAGEYIVISNRSNERQKICVENALRLGSSDLKRAYVFDDFPYIIFVMKDRIHFYDPSIETYVYTENYLCPKEIKHIAGGKLLLSTEHSEGTSLSIFNTDKLCIENSLEVDKVLAHSKDYKKLYVLDKCGSSVSIVRTETLDAETEFQDINPKDKEFYHIDNENGLLYVAEDKYINVIYINSNNVRRFNKENIIGITNSGFIIRDTGSQYEYEDLKHNSIGIGRFKYNPLICNFHVDGLAIANIDWEPRTDIRNSKVSYSDISNEFAQECRETMTNENSSTQFIKKIEWNSMKLSSKFYPSKDGVYIIEERFANYMTYYKQTDNVSICSCSINKNIIWISREGYETSHGNGGNSSYIDDILVKDNQALLRVSSSSYLLLKNGEIVAKLENQNEAENFMPSATEKTDPIIIDGSDLSTNSIICQSEKKLVYMNNNVFSYCELSNAKWNKIKTINLEEEKHTKAKMSSDGKYLVYSKGSNKYALYNILEQKEETVLTGNFIDFDKTGKLLFLENEQKQRARELRIYNPITFEWEKRIAEYYTFVSPDGKLYAKTGLKSRIFNNITKEELTTVESIRHLRKEYDLSLSTEYTDEERTVIEDKRKNLVSNNLSYFKSYSSERKYPNNWIDKIQKVSFPSFSEIFIQKKQYVVIGVVGTDQELEIELNNNLSFLNYVAFSYDNKYVGIVGKPNNNGYLKLVKIKYNEVTNSLSLERVICDTEFAGWATWICAFTKTGLFGTYDSAPDLYLINESDFEKFNEENASDFNFIKNQFRIEGRSLLCFSPSGRFMALSNQGYEPKSLGGRGHVPSNEVYIYDTETRKQLSHWQDQGDKIADRNVANAGFSIDESKLMTVSMDGVIVVRNIREDMNNEGKVVSEFTLSIAS